MKDPHKILFAQKPMQNFTCTWPEHSTIVSSWMLKCNVVAVAEKIWISQNILFYLLAAACPDGSAWNERKKLQHFYQLVLNMVWGFWKSYARTFKCLELLRWDRTRDKGAMRTILGSNVILCWTLNLHWYVFLGSCDHWIIAFSQINGCYSSRCLSWPTKALR